MKEKNNKHREPYVRPRMAVYEIEPERLLDASPLNNMNGCTIADWGEEINVADGEAEFYPD